MTQASSLTSNLIQFQSSSVMGREQQKKVLQLLQSLLDSTDSFQFRTPVDWKAYNLLDYPTIIKRPMDLGTVKKNISCNVYQTVQDCLKDILLIWQNCKIYNKENQFYQKLSDKLDKMTKKMIKNYLPFVIFENVAEKKKPGPVPGSSKKDGKKPTVPISNKVLLQPKTYQDRKQNQIQQQKQDNPFIKLRKQFLFFIPLCSSQQIGVMFMLINKNQPEGIKYDEKGQVRINVEKLTDYMVKRLIEQMDMWGIGYVTVKKK